MAPAGSPTASCWSSLARAEGRSVALTAHLPFECRRGVTTARTPGWGRVTSPMRSPSAKPQAGRSLMSSDPRRHIHCLRPLSDLPEAGRPEPQRSGRVSRPGPSGPIASSAEPTDAHAGPPSSSNGAGQGNPAAFISQAIVGLVRTRRAEDQPGRRPRCPPTLPSSRSASTSPQRRRRW